MAHSPSGHFQSLLAGRLSALHARRPLRPGPARARSDDAPGFLRGGFASLTPGLTQEICQALGESAAQRMGAVP